MRYKRNFSRGELIDLWEFLKHGDERHQEWLLEAIENWFQGLEKPKVR